MKKITITIAIILSSIFFISCEKTDINQIDDVFYLKNEGAEMPVFVRGSAAAKKILVIVHGGPGGTSLNHYYQIPEFTSQMEKEYLLVYWEQRGSGMSSGKLDADDFTLDKMSSDLDQLLHVLAHRYGGEKELFLLGQSFGSLLTAKFVSSVHAADHNIAGWITIGAVYSFTDYSQRLHTHSTLFLDEQNDPEWDDLKLKAASLDYTESTLETISEWNAFGDEMQKKTRELGESNPRQVTGIDAFSSGFFSQLTVLFNDLNASQKIFEDIYNQSLREELEQAQIPAIWLCGEHDYVTPLSYGDSLMTFYGHPDKQHIVIPRGGHNVIATNLEETMEVMTEFMENH